MDIKLNTFFSRTKTIEFHQRDKHVDYLVTIHKSNVYFETDIYSCVGIP